MRPSFVLALLTMLPLAATSQARPAAFVATPQASATDAEGKARALLARDPRSTAGRALLAEALAGQSRWKEAVDTLLEASRLVPADERVNFGMVMCEFARARPQMPMSEARRLFDAGDAVAGAVLAKAPDDHGALMLRSGALGMLAERLPAGPEKSRLEKASNAAFDRIMALAPKAEETSAEPPPSKRKPASAQPKP